MWRHLNLANAWPGLQLHGLVNDAGRLRLESHGRDIRGVSGREAPSGRADTQASSRVPALGNVLGLGIDADANVYIADAPRHRVVRWRPGDGRISTLSCFAADGQAPGQLRAPGGVAVGPHARLYIADSGNHRVQVLSLSTRQVCAVWGQTDPYSPPQPGDAPGRMNDPRDVAVDSLGFVYVADHGNGRVQKFDADGRLQAEFAKAMGAEAAKVAQPVHVAIACIDGADRLLVLDAAAADVLVFLPDGRFDAAATRQWAQGCAPLPMNQVFVRVAALAGAVSPDSPDRLLHFDAGGRFVGERTDYSGPPAGLHLERNGRFRLLPGAPAGLPGLGFASSGRFVAGPLEAPGRQATRWQRVSARVLGLGPHTHVQFFTSTDPQANGWQAAPVDTSDFLVPYEPSRRLWIAGDLQGDGTDTPALEQIRLAYDEPGWLPYLPAIYATVQSNSRFLDGFLAVMRSLMDDVEAEIDGLPGLIDATATPDDASGAWLDWLAGWLAADLEDDWSDGERRTAVAGAFERSSRRGTVQGMVDQIVLHAGVKVAIEEPLLDASVWTLGENSVLGFTTMLAAAEPAGALLGTTATLGASHLIADADYGLPLFEDLAHRFIVRVHAAEVQGADALDRLRRAIEREKPAHTVAHLRVVEARLCVGLQARVGIDAVVAGPVQPSPLGEAGPVVFAPRNEPPPATVGDGSRLGVGTRLA